MNYPPLTTAALVPYSSLNSFSKVVPAEKMAELEYRLIEMQQQLNIADASIAYLVRKNRPK